MNNNRTERTGSPARPPRKNMNPNDTGRMTVAEVLVELQVLIGTDNSERIAQRLGYSELESLLSAVRRAGRYDLSERLSRTAPLPLDGMKAASVLGFTSPGYQDSARAAWRRNRAAAA